MVDICCTQNIQYTEVVIIGNGPSAISLSYLLAGHRPYYTGDQHPDEYLQLRLNAHSKDVSLVEQDLEFLSNGLEGRSANPIALLFDVLTHPDADKGSEHPSVLRWKYEPECEIPHVVLGKHAEGGAWQRIEGKMQTLSLGTWMQLPEMPIKDWLNQQRKEKCRNMTVCSNRASMEDIRQYYMEYVAVKGLKKHFQNYATVMSVRKVLDVCHRVDDESGEQVPCDRDHSGLLKWEVCGYITKPTGQREQFCYRSPYVVVATGTFDLPNKLGVVGEQLPYVVHSHGEMEQMVESGQLSRDLDPLVVVGAGLSAADAILYALERGIPVVHVFRRDIKDPNLALGKLPAALYPEYHHIHRLMTGKDEADGYVAYPTHSVAQFLEDQQILIKNQHNCDIIIKTACVLVSIGSRPNLSFLPKEGRNLGLIKGMAIDSKHNPIDVDPITYQSRKQCGLYAMGPLVGENFVRFLRGGALAITSHLCKKREGKL